LGAGATLRSARRQFSFAGLTPGGVGLYQINFQIPADAAAGSLRVVVKQKAVEANIVTVPVVR